MKEGRISFKVDASEWRDALRRVNAALARLHASANARRFEAWRRQRGTW